MLLSECALTGAVSISPAPVTDTRMPSQGIVKKTGLKPISFQPVPASCADKASITLQRPAISVGQGCLKGMAPSLLSKESWRQVRAGAYIQKTSLTSSKQPGQPRVPCLGWGSGWDKDGDLSVSHTVLVLLAFHLGHID